MPLVDIHVIKGVFTPEQKSAMIAGVTEAMVAAEGETLRGVTWVKIIEVRCDPEADLWPILRIARTQTMVHGSIRAGQPALAHAAPSMRWTMRSASAAAFECASM